MSSRQRPSPRNGEESVSYDERQADAAANAALQAELQGTNATEITADLLRETVETGVENHRNILANLLAKDYPLANLTSDERVEKKHVLRAIWELFRIIHPNPEFLFDSDDQKWLYDDPDASLEPLDQQELFENFVAFDIVDTRVTRGKDMKQQEINSTSITEARTRRHNPERSNSGILDRLRRK